MDGPGWMLRRERERRGWTHEETAERMRRVARRMDVRADDIDGLSVRRWEARYSPLPFRHLRLLAAVFDIPLTDLMGLTSPDRRQREWLSIEPDGVRLVEGAMIRREFLRYVCALTGASLARVQHLSDHVDDPSVRTLDDLILSVRQS